MPSSSTSSSEGRVPQERVFTVPRGEVAGVILGTLLLVLAVNALAQQLVLRAGLDFTVALVREKWRLLRQLEKPVDWLILGDSAAAYCVEPATLCATLGGEAVNLGSVAPTVLGESVWKLEQYLARFPSPRGVVLVAAGNELPVGPTESVHAYVPVGAAERRALTMLWEPTLAGRWERFLSYYAPLYAKSETLGAALQYPWHFFRKDFGRMRADGFVEARVANPAELERSRPVHVRLLRAVEADAPGKALASEIRRALERIAELAASRGFDVYLACSPEGDTSLRDPYFRACVEASYAELGVFSRGRERWHLLFVEALVYPAAKFASGNHLTVEGAREYTADVAARIARLRGEAAPPTYPGPQLR